MYSLSFLKRFLPVAFLLGLAVFSSAIWGVVWAETSPERLTFAVLDIGQGDALYIKSPTGVEVLVDGGRGDGALLRELSNVMRAGDRTIDAVVATHPDADHIGGLVDLLKRYEVQAFIESGIEKQNSLTDALEEEVTKHKIPTYVARRGMSLELGGGARLDVLFPDIDVSYFGERSNDGTIVARLVYGDTSVLLTGDATFFTEGRLLAISTSTELMSDILKVGHHGSKYSTGEAFLEAVQPSTALISVGAKNTYGHPAPRVLELFGKSGITVLRTDEEGTLVFYSDGVQFTRQK